MATAKGYGQYCPVSRAAEILAERWTPLVIRELLLGSVRFNDIRRGVPRMSTALLSRRLRELEAAGIIERRDAPGGRGSEYHPTEAAQELFPIVVGMGNWAQRWLREDLTLPENQDPDVLMWDIRRTITKTAVPTQGRYVAQFDYDGVPVSRRRYWLVFDDGDNDLCVKDPGYDVDLYVSAHIRTMIEVWLGHVPIAEARRTEALRLDGSRKDIEAFEAWFSLSTLAEAGKQPPGRQVSA